MSIQSSTSIPISILSPPENVRLLELPPELLAIIDDRSDPKILSGAYPVLHLYNTRFNSRIQLKSAPTDNSSTATRPQEQYLHLCTKSHVWAVRQVSTSNSVYVLTTSLPPTATNEPAPSNPGVMAFAQPTSTLELLPSPFTTADIDGAIRRLLPEHPVVTDFADDGDDDENIPKSGLNDSEIDAALPYPHLAVAQAKRHAFVFTAPNDGAYVPSAQLLLAAWRKVVEYANAQSINLSKFEMLYLNEITSLMAHDEGTLLPAVMQAIVREFVDDSELRKDTGDGDLVELERAAGWMEGKLKGREVTQWVGGLLVQCAEGGIIGKTDLESQWQDLVPSQWWKWCKIVELGGACIEDVDVVRWRGTGKAEAVGDSAKTSEKEPAPASSVLGKRNWHEKFAAQRKR